jgi:WD40 repeat protein
VALLWQLRRYHQDLAAGRQHQHRHPQTYSVPALALSADNKWLYSGSYDYTIKIWRLADNTCTATLPGHTDFVNALALSADNKWLYSGSYDYTIKIWRLADNSNTATLSGHTDWVRALTLSADNQRLYSASADRTIKIWRVQLLTFWSEPRHDHLFDHQRLLIFQLLAIQQPLADLLAWDDLRHVIQSWCALWTLKLFLSSHKLTPPPPKLPRISHPP